MLCLPLGNVRRRCMAECEMTQAADQVPSGSTLKEVEHFLYVNTPNQADTKPRPEYASQDDVPQGHEDTEEIMLGKSATRLKLGTVVAYRTLRSPLGTLADGVPVLTKDLTPACLATGGRRTAHGRLPLPTGR